MITTKAIINLLPFQSEFKLDLLEKFDTLSEEEQARTADIIWQAFYMVYDIKLKNNVDKIMTEADKNGEKFDPTFYKKAADRTDDEIRELLASSSQTLDLEEARKSMEMIIREINAAKTSRPLKN